MFRYLFVALFVIAAPAAHASAPFGAVTLDPQGEIRPALLAQALTALRSHPEARRDRMAVVDFDKPSTQPRFFVVDLKSGAVEAFLTAHGRGSDSGDGREATRFSNEANSNASSLGAFLTAQTYVGKHGESLALDGLDASNANARARAIVLHAADYMDAEFIAAHGRPGRSLGCFAFDPGAIMHVIGELANGALIYAAR